MSLPDLKCFDYILLESPKIRRKQVSSIYRFGLDGKELEFKLIHSYQEKIPRIEPFAKLMSIAPAVLHLL
ncbi:hypothetical protein [Thermococcus piezophilus]|uniref:Uncharacterized protein n=1 Tax=Thermococcus piezophilus TaxID=1712654 RepID=A0A172WEF5_9EURY|nr:hypothetical protein [Thermococcus piezophilus]ANF21810.1 hypothetical protein A7C91_00250 [Thermococcus piezophilus]